VFNRSRDGQITPPGPHLSRQTPCRFFSSITFPTVDSSAKALAAACLMFHLSATATLTCKYRYKNVNKMVWSYCTTMHFNNLFLHRLRKSHCIRSSSDQAVANSPSGQEVWSTLNKGAIAPNTVFSYEVKRQYLANKDDTSMRPRSNY